MQKFVFHSNFIFCRKWKLKISVFIKKFLVQLFVLAKHFQWLDVFLPLKWDCRKRFFTVHISFAQKLWKMQSWGRMKMVSKRVNVPSLQVNIFWDTFTIFLRCSVFFFWAENWFEPKKWRTIFCSPPQELESKKKFHSWKHYATKNRNWSCENVSLLFFIFCRKWNHYRSKMPQKTFIRTWKFSLELIYIVLSIFCGK